MNMQHKRDQFGNGEPIEIRPFATFKQDKAIAEQRIKIHQLHMASRAIAEDYPELAAWLCISVRPYAEFSTVEAMQEQNIEAIVPTYRGEDVRHRGRKISGSMLPVVPGYVFIRCAVGPACVRALLRFEVQGDRKRRVTGIIGGAERPYRFKNEIIDGFIRDSAEGIYDFRPPADVYYVPGEHVKIIAGPFASFMGVVIDWDGERNRAKVEASIFGRSTPIDLDVAQIRKV